MALLCSSVYWPLLTGMIIPYLSVSVGIRFDIVAWACQQRQVKSRDMRHSQVKAGIGSSVVQHHTGGNVGTKKLRFTSEL